MDYEERKALDDKLVVKVEDQQILHTHQCITAGLYSTVENVCCKLSLGLDDDDGNYIPAVITEALASKMIGLLVPYLVKQQNEQS